MHIINQWDITSLPDYSDATIQHNNLDVTINIWKSDVIVNVRWLVPVLYSPQPTNWSPTDQLSNRYDRLFHIPNIKNNNSTGTNADNCTFCADYSINKVSCWSALIQEAPLTLRGQRGRCRNIKGEPQIFGSSPNARLRPLFLWVWFYASSWQIQVVYQIWSR